MENKAVYRDGLDNTTHIETEYMSSPDRKRKIP